MAGKNQRMQLHVNFQYKSKKIHKKQLLRTTPSTFLAFLDANDAPKYVNKTVPNKAEKAEWNFRMCKKRLGSRFFCDKQLSRNVIPSL